MRGCSTIKGWGVVALLLLLAPGAACAPDAREPAPLSPTEAVELNAAEPPPKIARTEDILPSATLLPTPLAESTATPTALPPPTATTEPASWYAADTMALVVADDSEQADLYALNLNGGTEVVFTGVGDQVNVSPGGNWLSFVRWGRDGHATLELHDAQSSKSRSIAPATTSGLLRLAFDPPGQRLAYLDLGPPDATGVPWDLVVVDLESGAESRYEALMTEGERGPLPGAPIGWASVGAAGDEVLLDTFFPYSEGGWQGVWGVTLPPGGAPAPFDALPARALIPGAAYASELYLAPDGQTLAFLGRDPDYFPANYFPEFYDLAVNRLEIAAVADGARTTLVEAADGSALGRALAWSPAGARLLFAQGNYAGESFAALTLKSSDLGGAVVEHGPLTLPPLGGLLELAWCQKSLPLYVTWDGSDGTQRLFGFDLASGLSSELLAAQRVEIVGCAPQGPR